MNREQTIAKLLALEERKRRQALLRPTYTPNEGQAPVHQSTARYRWVFSGNGAGKTALLVQEIWAAATGRNDFLGTKTKVPVRMCLIVDNVRKIEEVILPELRKWFVLTDDMLKKDGKPHTNRIIWECGSVLTFYSQEADPSSFEGVEFDYSFADEPLPKPLFIAITRGGRKKGSANKWLYCGTALSQPWMRIDIHEPWSKGEMDEHECFRAETEANAANLDEGYIARFKKVLSAEEQEVRLKGGFFDSAGLALGHLWNRSTHIMKASAIEWDKETFPTVIGVDPHPSKAHVAMLLGADRHNQLYALKELSAKLPARDFAHKLVELWGTYRVTDVIVDNFGSADSTGQEGFISFIEILNKVFQERGVGWRARPTTYQEKDDEAWIARLQDSLLIPEKENNFGQRIPKLRVSDECKGLIQNIESVGWQRDKRLGITKPKLDITQKDYLAALKYALGANIHFKRGKNKPFYLTQPRYGLYTPAQRRAKITLGARLRGKR